MYEPVIVSGNQLANTYKSSYYRNLSLKKYKSLLPLKLSPSLVRIFASLITDGFMDIRPQGNTTKYSYIGYFSKYQTELVKFNKSFYNLFQVKGTIRDWGVREYGESMGCIINNSVLTRLLHLAGVPGGDKTIQTYSIPSYILHASPSLKSLFLKRIFSCEGSINGDDGWRIRYSMSKTQNLSYNTLEFLNQLQKMLGEFEIKTTGPYLGETYRRDKDHALMEIYVIQIRRKESISNFEKYIGFDIPYKQQKQNLYCKQGNSEY